MTMLLLFAVFVLLAVPVEADHCGSGQENVVPNCDFDEGNEGWLLAGLDFPSHSCELPGSFRPSIVLWSRSMVPCRTSSLRRWLWKRLQPECRFPEC